MIRRRGKQYTRKYVPFSSRKRKHIKTALRDVVAKNPVPYFTFRGTSYRRDLLRTGGFTGIEYKFIDTTYTNTLVGTWAGAEADPAGNNLCSPQQGTGESQRDGRVVTIKKIDIHGYVQRGQASDQADHTAPSIIHVALVLDTQTNGVQLNAEDVYVDANHVEVNFRNLQYKDRFRVLKSKYLVVGDAVSMRDDAAGPPCTASIAGSLRRFYFGLKCNIKVHFSANAGTVADITDNSLHIIAVSSQGAIDQMFYQSRVRFVG